MVKSSWDDVTWGEYLSIVDKNLDTYALLSVLTGVDADTFRKAKITGADQLLAVIQFAKKPMEILKDLSKVGKYNLPMKGGKFDVQFESLGQFEDLRTVMTTGIKTPEDLLKSYTKAVAIYIQKIKDGEYDGLKATDMEAEVLLLPCREVLTAGSFFIVKLLGLSNGIKASSRKAASQSKPIGKTSHKHSGRTVRLTKHRGR